MKGIDHLVYTVADLERGMDNIEGILGVRPVRGGRHPSFGTHNALLSLGESTYLEVIAPDPELSAPESGLPFGMSINQESKLATWAYRCDAIEEQAELALRAGLDIGNVASGSRRTQNGVLLVWKLTDPNVMLLDGAVPFLIGWGQTPHPAAHAPKGGVLVDFRIEHPQSARVKSALAVLRVTANISSAEGVNIIAVIEAENGRVKLK